MPELTALYWPTINSYKRSVENTWAPTTATWGRENRTCAHPGHRRLDPKSTRVEYRQLGADMNPYVGMAASLAAGLWGIEHQIEPARAGLGQRLPQRRRRRCRATCVTPSPSSIGAPSPGSSWATEFVDHYLRTRDWEVRQYERAVTTWELERYFELA